MVGLVVSHSKPDSPDAYQRSLQAVGFHAHECGFAGIVLQEPEGLAKMRMQLGGVGSNKITVGCSICDWSTECGKNMLDGIKATREHYYTAHSWLRRRWQRLLEFPSNLRFKRYQWRTRKKF